MNRIDGKVRIAHVGVSIKVGFPQVDPNNPEREIWGENDRWHIDSVFRWLYENTDGDHELLYEDRGDDFIDLNDGRDFLQENYKYDIVILHMIYSPDDPIRNSYRSGPGIYITSPLHTRDNWRRRLQQTGAKYIFTFGDFDEVSGEYLGCISGYDGPINAGNYLNVYVKQNGSDTITTIPVGSE